MSFSRNYDSCDREIFPSQGVSQQNLGLEKQMIFTRNDDRVAEHLRIAQDGGLKENDWPL